MSPTILRSLRVPRETWARIEQLAAERGETRTQVALDLLRLALDAIEEANK
jgi:hypothetical protein